MKRTIVAAMAAIALSAVGSTLSAQGVQIGLGGGVLIPMSNYKDVDKMGWLGGADATYWLTGAPIAIRIEGDYSQTSHKNSIPGHTSVVGGMAQLVYALGTSDAQMRPYVLGGVGYFHAKVDVTGFGSASENKLGWGVGAGVAFKMGAGSSQIFVEGRYQSVQTSGSALTMIPIRAGIRFGS